MLRRLERSRLALAGLLLLSQAWLFLASPLHDAQESHGGAGVAANVAGFEPACPPDCQEPGHQHRSHDPATCASCKAFRAAVKATRRVRVDPVALAPHCWFAPTGINAVVQRGGPHCVRGPPGSSFLA